MDCRRIVSETFLASAEHHEVIGSTNDRARQCAAEGLPLPRLVMADRQAAGRGRGSHWWWTPSGSLAMSLLLPADALPDDRGRSSLVSLLAGVAVVDALRPLVEQRISPDRDPACKTTRPSPLGLHWPNDVMLAGRKVAGILVEALPSRAHVIGIGVNTNNTAADAPDELREKLATLRDLTGTTCDHVELIIDLLRRMEIGFQLLRNAPKEVAQRADELCLQRGQELSIHVGEQTITGRCQGIAPNGALRLVTPDGPREIHSGVIR